jgi:hypothetical protein
MASSVQNEQNAKLSTFHRKFAAKCEPAVLGEKLLNQYDQRVLGLLSLCNVKGTFYNIQPLNCAKKSNC